MMTSLKSSLKKAWIKEEYHIPGDFQIFPEPCSLKELIWMLNLPNPDLNDFSKEKMHSFEETNAQGITYAYKNFWLLSSEHKVFKFLISGENLQDPVAIERKGSKSLSDIIDSLKGSVGSYDHIGDIAYIFKDDFYFIPSGSEEGILFLPIRNKNYGDNPHHLLVGLSNDLSVVGYSHLPKDIKDSACAINPFNHCIYLLNKGEGGKSYFSAFDISEYIFRLNDNNHWREELKLLPRPEYDIHLKENGEHKPIEDFQGIAFSKNGRIYISHSKIEKRFLTGKKRPYKWKNYVSIYNALNGELLNSKTYDFADKHDEMEGLTIHPSGTMAIAVAIHGVDGALGLDPDVFRIYAYKHKDPAFKI